MNNQMRFRLFDLPGELVEDISFLLFDIQEAHKPLTVSPEFHSLFSRRVWWKLDSRIFTSSEPPCSLAISRYGTLVRYVELSDEISSAIESIINGDVSIYDVLSLFSGVTTLKIWDDHNLLVSNGIQYRDVTMCFPNLYKLVVVLEADREPYDLVTLALAINHRQNHRSMNPIEYLSVSYLVSPTDARWTQLSNFVQMVMNNYGMNIRINSRHISHCFPSQSELQILNKHLVHSPNIEAREDAQFCYAALNHLLFSRPSTELNNTCGYPQLRQLSMRACCASSDTYDYCDIAPSNFLDPQGIQIIEHECNNMIVNSYPPAWKKVLLQSWPHLNELTLSLIIPCEQLVVILKRHCGLTRLELRLQPKMLDENNAFNLATILPLLPKLQRLIVSGESEMKLDYSPDYDDYDILIQSQMKFIWFGGFRMSSRIFKLLFSLSKLDKLTTDSCKLYSTGVTEVANMDSLIGNPNEIDIVDDDDDGEDATLYLELMTILNTISTKSSFKNQCNIEEFNLSISRDNYNWPLDVTLEMIALMPRLRYLDLFGETDDIPNAVKARFPFIKVYYRPFRF